MRKPWGQGKFSAKVIAGFRDGHVFTAPVGSYPSNFYGFHDLGGNVYEWCEDKDTARGDSWYGGGAGVASQFRFKPRLDRDDNFGFRCVVKP